jgi:hypothetical protein
VRLEPASASATAASLSPPSSTSTQPLETPNAALSTVAPTEVSGDTLDDDFNSGQLDTTKWQPPDHPEFISVEDNALHIRVTEQQTADGAQTQLKPVPTGRFIQEISFTITTASWAGKKEGGVGIRLYMTDDIDHLVNAVHLNGLGIDIANCKQAPCKGNYDEYNHDETPIQVGRPAQVRIVWNKEKGQIGFYINGVLHAVPSAKETPIKEFSFGMYATSGDAFDVTIDNVHVVYTQ